MQGSKLMKHDTRREREGKDKIVDVTSENTQSVYSNFVASNWTKKVGADWYVGGYIFGSGQYKQPIPKIIFWYRLILTADTKNEIPFFVSATFVSRYKKLRAGVTINHFSSSEQDKLFCKIFRENQKVQS
jgi:hypothetical protein